jgi:glycosyltransferase involved in cell wall biosynthesis
LHIFATNDSFKMTSLSKSAVPPPPDDSEKLSIVVPIYNEEESIMPLCNALDAVISKSGKPYEVILVNDGSIDRSWGEIVKATEIFPKVIGINLRRNYGQTAALMAGIDHASGETIVLIDADLQNDPADIPRLLDKLAEGYDVVSGWRHDRKDAAFRRNFTSRVANFLISWISGVHLHDYGCTLKAYHRSVIKGVRLYGEMHRFIPIYASWMGAKVCEIPVEHHARKFGVSKYGLNRIFKVTLDLIVVKFLDRYFVKPIYVFGGFGVFTILLSMVFLALMIYWKLVDGISMIETPIPVLSAITFLIGMISILMGLLAEVLVRIYFESEQRSTYLVKDVVRSGYSD